MPRRTAFLLPVSFGQGNRLALPKDLIQHQTGRDNKIERVAPSDHWDLYHSVT